MGKFEDIINENRVNQLQEVLMDFFGQTVPQKRLIQLTKNSRGFVQAAVSVDPDYSFDKTARKFRPDQVGQKVNNIGNNRVMANRIQPARQATTQKPVTEAATVDSVQKFAQWVGMKPLDTQTAENVAKRWPEFIEEIKNKLQWNYGIERAEQPAPEQPAPEQPAPEQPAPEDESEPPVNPVGKSLFKRGIEAAGRGLKSLGSAAAGAISNQNPYDPNSNRNPFGDLGVSKVKLSQNTGKIDSKEIDE
ncbi:MAG: hypothetical protein EBR72_08690, partial [Bacteroidetes bacterium]|nr:hypothetical protein [Bacteroidota bacterium]